MELQEQDIILLEAYLAGELEGEALLDCEARLKREPELAETLAGQRGLHFVGFSLTAAEDAAVAVRVARRLREERP